MLDQLAKGAFSLLADSSLLRRLASHYGMRSENSFARRFVAGERTAEAIDVAGRLERAGLGVILDYLGEHVSSTAAATVAVREYLDMIAAARDAGLSHHVAVKLSQLGIDVDRATAVDNLRRILEAAAQAGFFVRLDMESASYVDRTFDAFETLWKIGYQQAGLAIQAYLRRSPADVERTIALGASVRLVKGAYNEPKDIAFQHKSEVDDAFVTLMKTLLERGRDPSIATHDQAMIDQTIRFAESIDLPKDRYSFEMLYGVRRDLQTSLAARGYAVRIYLPFGQQWFPYFMRRLGERPANIGFVLKSVMKDQG
jgi:proline dehydrogenase